MSRVLEFGRDRRRRLLLIGNGMATSRVLDELIARDALRQFAVTVLGEERHGIYNRVLLGKILTGAPLESITLKDTAWFAEHGVRFLAGVRALRIDHEDREVFATAGIREPYDDLIIATGSRAVIPSLPGLREDDRLKPGVFVFRTAEDGAEIRDAARPGDHAVVLGGGLLGLEAAKGLADRGLRVTVLARSSGLMNRQLDPTAGAFLAERLNALGIASLAGAGVRSVRGERAVEGVELEDGSLLPCEVLILACGIVPRVEVAKSSGIAVHRGILVDDQLRIPGQPHLYAVGECAEHRGIVYGLVAPIYDQARALVGGLTGDEHARFSGARLYTRLKVAGVEVASMGELEPRQPTDEVVIITEPQRHTYRKLILREDRLIGAQFVGDATAAARVLQLWDRAEPLPENRLDILSSEDAGACSTTAGDREICNCYRVSQSRIVEAVQQGHQSVEALGERTGAGRGCGSCRGELARLLRIHAPATTVSPEPTLRVPEAAVG